MHVYPYSHAPPLLVAYRSDDKGSGLNLKSCSEVTEGTSEQPLNYYSVALIYKIMACKPTPSFQKLLWQLYVFKVRKLTSIILDLHYTS